MSEDLECLCPSASDLDGSKIIVGKKADLERALLVEFPKFQKPSDDGNPKFVGLAIHTK